MAQKQIKQILQEYSEGTKKHFDQKTEETKRHFDQKTEETKKHFDVVAEGLKDEIKLVAEGVAINTEKLEKHDQRFDKIDQTLLTMKLDIGFIKNELKQKVDRDEFAVLEKRVSLIEAKIDQ